MEGIDIFGLETGIRNILGPWVGILLSVIIILLIKDIIFSLIKGIKFKLKPGFEPGDNCYIDGEHATIIRISMLETVFEIDNGRGKVWRYIPNDKLDSIVLERIIVPKDEETNPF